MSNETNTTANPQTVQPRLPQFPFILFLDKTLKGPTVLNNPACTFEVQWNFQTGQGQASLLAIDNSPVNIVLYPIGIKGQLDFMSDMQPTQYQINGQNVTIDRVILDFTLPTYTPSAALILNGRTVQVTANFDPSSTALSQ